MKRFIKTETGFINFRRGGGILLNLVLRHEQASNFKRLRKSQLYDKRRGDKKDGILILGSVLGFRKNCMDNMRTMVISTHNYHHSCRYHINISSQNVSCFWRADLRDIQKRRRDGRGRKSFLRIVDRSIPRH